MQTTVTIKTKHWLFQLILTVGQARLFNVPGKYQAVPVQQSKKAIRMCRHPRMQPTASVLMSKIAQRAAMSCCWTNDLFIGPR